RSKSHIASLHNAVRAKEATNTCNSQSDTRKIYLSEIQRSCSVTLNNRLVELLSVVLVTSVLQRIDVQSNIGDNRLCLKSSSCNEDRRGHHTCNTDDSQSLRGELLRRQNALTQLRSEEHTSELQS